jgi:hypothetical protein
MRKWGIGVVLVAWGLAAGMYYLKEERVKAQEPSPKVLVLACEGEWHWFNDHDLVNPAEPKPKPEPLPGGQPVPQPVSLGIVIDFTAGKISFSEHDYPAEIKKITESSINFFGEEEMVPKGSESTEPTNRERINGSVDRVTGSAWVMTTLSIKGDDGLYFSGSSRTDHYSLHCKPAQRMF